jgi:hypothetical protein
MIAFVSSVYKDGWLANFAVPPFSDFFELLNRVGLAIFPHTACLLPNLAALLSAHKGREKGILNGRFCCCFCHNVGTLPWGTRNMQTESL